ncbi:hypothetical protein BKA70DRAFT_367440 [Coprinopsis sp. MPI-PUGE-AT-0042]|nr:hypothetical protein BKA70DRAFT_367440 [Coprinopsis sp. MPI-PUGE-AT-0042]
MSMIRLYLILGYTHGLQIWDTTNFKSVAEVFNVNFDPDTLVGLGFGEGEVEVVDALFVPSPPARKGRKGGKWKENASGEEKPVLGILFRSTSPEGHARTIFALYSLKTHVVVGKVEMEGYAERFEANERVVVISTSSPPTLHVLSSPSLNVLYTFQSSSLASFVHLPSTRPSGLSSDNLTYQEPRQPKPVFALHGRLLAFAALSPSSSSRGEKGGADKRRGSSASSSGGSGTGTGVSPASGSGSPFGFALTGLSSNISGLRSQVQGKLPTTQAELGSAALKVGSGVLSGMRFLGGKAVEVAKNQMSKSAPTEPGGLSAASGTDRERKRHSSNLALLSPIESEVGGKKSGGGGVGPSTTYRKVERGSLVRVVDLLGLVSPLGRPSSFKGSATPSKAPMLVAEFIASRSQTIANLKFAPDGCSILAVPKDGQVTKVFKLHPQFPSPSPSTASSSSTPSAMEEESTGTATHLYDLRRGVSGAVIEGLEVLDDGLLVGVTTRNRTVHIFGTNPGGGRMDVGSHASGKVRNGVLIPQGRVPLHPIVRIHGARIALQPEAEAQREHAALAFTFINSNDSVSFPPSLAPARLSNVPSSPPLPSSSPPSRSPNLNNPSLAGRHPHSQDALLFDALSGTLFLQRITLDSRLKDSRPGTSLSSVSTSLTSGFAAMGMGSVPGMGGAGVLSRSVSSSVSDRSGVSSRAGANVAGRSVGGRGGEEAMELVASCSVVATWNLQRGKEWKEIRNPVVLERKVKQRLAGNDEWLAQAELSTFSRASSNASQRSIYLSHQFSFYTLGEDYQGAIRLYRLAPAGTKIDVRKDIPIQAFSSSLPSHAEGGDGFLDEFNSPTSPRGIRGIASSFDEPLASALTHEMEGVGAVGVTEVELPMYPNGVPGKRGLLSSSITAIPVRGIGDGVSRGFGQLRRRIGKRGRKADGGDGIAEEDMAFEFDEEEDGEFMAPRIASLKSESKKRSGSHPPRSLNSSIHTEIDDDVVGQVDEELWGQRGWDDQDQQALDDEEKFQTISKTVPLSPPAVTSSTLGPISLPKVGSSGSLPGAQGSLGKSSGRRKKKRAGREAR